MLYIIVNVYSKSAMINLFSNTGYEFVLPDVQKQGSISARLFGMRVLRMPQTHKGTYET